LQERRRRCGGCDYGFANAVINRDEILFCKKNDRIL